MAKKPNILFFGIDSLRRDHMSSYGYGKTTTPHIDKYAEKGVLFEQCFSPSIPTTPGYSSMLTGMDCFSTNVVALRHQGGIVDGVQTLPEVLRENGYNTTCVGFSGNAASRGFDKYLDFSGWGSWEEGRSPKAENLNAVAIPELERLAGEDKPFFLFLRHMDPHAPYLAPEPFHRMFFNGNEFDKNNKSLDPVYNFKPFCDFFRTWFPPGCTSSDYIIAQYDAEVAYMDSCIQVILAKLEALGIENETLVVFTSDHGETHYDHECWFDHHGIYECTLSVPFILRFPGKLPEGKRFADICQLKDIMPTILDILGVKTKIKFDGRNMLDLINNKDFKQEPEMYISECTWQRKHGWRTPEWKLMIALEPDFHFKPEIELYNLIKDPGENNNVAKSEPGVVKFLTDRLNKHVAKREKATGRENPMLNNINWHGAGNKTFKTSEEAYNTLHIGDPETARRLQAEGEKRK